MHTHEKLLTAFCAPFSRSEYKVRDQYYDDNGKRVNQHFYASLTLTNGSFTPDVMQCVALRCRAAPRVVLRCLVSCKRMLMYAARCGILRHSAASCGENDAMCRIAPHRNALHPV